MRLVSVASRNALEEPPELVERVPYRQTSSPTQAVKGHFSYPLANTGKTPHHMLYCERLVGMPESPMTGLQHGIESFKRGEPLE